MLWFNKDPHRDKRECRSATEAAYPEGRSIGFRSATALADKFPAAKKFFLPAYRFIVIGVATRCGERRLQGVPCG